MTIRVLKNSLMFLPTIILFMGIEIYLSTLPVGYAVKDDNLAKRASEIKVLLLGDSHADAGFNPAFIGYDSFNGANPSQDYFYNSKILYRHLDRLTNLKVVVLNVSYRSFQYRMFDKTREAFYAKYLDIQNDYKHKLASILDIKTYSRIFLWGPDSVIKYSLTGFPIANIDNAGFSPYLRGKNESDLDKYINEKTGKERIDIHHKMMKKMYVDYNIKIIQKLIDSLSARNIRVCLITTPVFSTYQNNESQENIDIMKSSVQRLGSSNNIRYYDYSGDSRFNKYDFFDNDHLNNIGSQKFSQIIKHEVIEPTLKF